MAEIPTHNAAKPNTEPSFSRKACLEDFLEPCQNNHNNYSNNDQYTISKNQQEFGNRKRIKP